MTIDDVTKVLKYFEKCLSCESDKIGNGEGGIDIGDYIAYSKHVSQELKNKLLTDELLEITNRFHRIEECGKIERLVEK